MTSRPFNSIAGLHGQRRSQLALRAGAPFVLAGSLLGCSSTDVVQPAKTTITSPTTATQVGGTRGAESPGCRFTDRVAAGRTVVTLPAGDRDRTYIRYVPAGARPTKATPLVIDLTAYAPADLQETFTGFTKPDEAGRVKADEVQAVVAMPEPVNGEGLKTWNISHTDGWTDDQRFIADLIDDVGAATCIDLDRVLVMGFAIGGFMASAVACEQPHRIALLATVAGLWNPPNCDTTERVPVIAFHGTDDQLLAYEGGVGARASETGIGEETSRGLVTVADQPGAKATAAAWADRNGCTGSPTIEAVTSVVARSSWSECTADVELYTIAGGGHTWPGSNGMANAEQFLGPVSQEIDANDVIWDFFVAHVPA